MKKLFALVGMAALIASCTNDDFLDAGQQDNQKVDLSKGIVFSIADDAVTRGFFPEGEDGKFGTNWNAEIDRIGVAFLNTPKNGTMTNQGKWCDVSAADPAGANVGAQELGGATAKLAIYKTTQSGTKGMITSVNDENLLTFSRDEAQKASFRVFRPAFTVTNGAEDATQRSAKFSTDGDKVATMKVALGDFTTQIQVTASKPNFANFFMVADPIDNVYESDFAVGESMKLSFARPLSALAVYTQNYDETVYGVLKSVKISKTNSEQKLSSSDATVDIAKKVADKWVITPGTGTSNEVTLKLADATPSGVAWSDDDYAFIQVLPVAVGAYTVTATFANGVAVFEKAGTNAWKANDFHKIGLDLNSQDIYLETGTKLIINTGSLLKDADAFDYNGASVNANVITEIVANKVLTTSELAILKAKYTGVTKMTLKGTEDLGANLSNIAGATVQGALTSLTLTEATTAPALDGSTLTSLATLSCPKATTVPANAYKSNTVLSNVNLPVVKTIGENAFSGATGIHKINCADIAANQLTIGTTVTDPTTSVTTKTSALKSIAVNAFAGLTGLTEIDIPSQAEIASKAFGTTCTATTILLPQYDYSASANMMNALILLNTSNLVEVDLSAVSTIDGSSIGFTQTSLTTVTLKEGVEITGPAFKGCANLATINNLDKAAVIGEGAFQSTALTAATINAEAIGKNAFNGCSNLATVTLGANVKTIGEGAFNGISNLATLNNNSNVTTIGKEAFKGTRFASFDFLTATEIGESAFQDCTALAGTVYSNVTKVAKNVFNGANQIDLFRFYKAIAIEEGALQGIKSAANIMFSAELTSIDATAFTITGKSGGDGSSAEKAITGAVAAKLTLNASQAGVEGSTWTFQSTDGKYYTLTFTSITK